MVVQKLGNPGRNSPENTVKLPASKDVISLSPDDTCLLRTLPRGPLCPQGPSLPKERPLSAGPTAIAPGPPRPPPPLLAGSVAKAEG